MSTKTTLEEYIQNAQLNVFLKRRMMLALAENPVHPIVPQIHSASSHQMDSNVHSEMGELLAERYKV